MNQIDIPDMIAGALGVSRGTAYDMMREALAEQQTQQQKPDAIVTSLTASPDGVARSGLDRELPLMASVYLAPQPAQRKPLTDEQIVAKALHLSGLGTSPDVIQFARAIEAAHGIKENT